MITPYGTTYKDTTPQAVIKILEKNLVARQNNLNSSRRLRLFYGDPETGRDWGEEFETTGYIGRSTGTKKIPLLIHNSNSTGGGGLLDDCIVKIIDCTTKQVLYQHPLYNQPAYTIEGEDSPPGFVQCVLVNADSKLVAMFYTRKQAQRWIDYMTGKRMSK